MTITINNDNKPILPSFLLCLWSNHPFGNRQYLIVNQLEIHLGKLLHLTELYKLSNELVQTISMVCDIIFLNTERSINHLIVHVNLRRTSFI